MADGQQSNFEQGSLNEARLVRLRSRKVSSGSSATAELFGQGFGSALGVLTKAVARAVSGIAATVARGVLSAIGAVQVINDIVQLGEKEDDGPNFSQASRGLGMNWITGGGDYLDASDVLNGSNHYASASASLGGDVEVPLTVTGIVTKLLVQNTGFYLSSNATTKPWYHASDSLFPPTLTIVTSTSTFTPPLVKDCYVDPGSVGCEPDRRDRLTPPPIKRNRFPSFLKFDLAGVTGTVTSATLRIYGHSNFESGKLIFVDYLRMPTLIRDPVRQLGGVVQGIAAAGANDQALASHPSVLFYPSFASNPAIRAAGWNVLPNHDGETPESDVCFDPQFIQWPQYGLDALRMSSQYPGQPWPGSGSTIIAWRKVLPVGIFEAYVRYLMKIDADAYAAINELGVKLPGFEGGQMSYRMEHLDQSLANPQVYGYFLHAYDADNPFSTGSAQNRRVGDVCLEAGRIYCIEQRVKMNTVVGGVAQADGIIQIWVDGVLCYSDTTRRINTVLADINDFFANFYHGGQATPLQAFHYEFGGVCVATEYIGPPKVVTPALPAWRQGMAINEWKEIPNTSVFSIATPIWSEDGVRGDSDWATGMFNCWTGAALDTRDATFWIGRSGGHAAYYGNQVLKIKLSDDAPTWVEARPPTRGVDILLNSRLHKDGRPPAAHTYYTTQFIEARNWLAWFGSPAVQETGTGFPNCPVFNPATGDYMPDLTIPDLADNNLAFPDLPICKDAAENVYIFRVDKVWKWTQVTNTLAVFLTHGFNVISGAVAYDSRRNRLVCTDGPIINLNPPSAVSYTRNSPSAWSPVHNHDAMVFEQHPTDPAQDRFVIRAHNSTGGQIITMRYVTDTSFFVEELATTGGATVGTSSSGAYNRFLAVPQYGGYVYCPVPTKVWFLRTR